MNFWTPKHIETITKGRWLVEPVEPRCRLAGINTDSRTIAPGQVFVAITGDHFDGHDFVDTAADGGAAMVIVSRPVNRPAAAALLVEDTVAALQDLARAYRDVLRDVNTKVIAVAGSNGKTTTRHMIHTVLSAKYRGTQSPGSFNNHLGVPLSLLAASPEHDFVVVEIGTNHPGEVAALADIVRPDAAVITSVGEEHLEFFDTVENVAIEEASVLAFVEPGGMAAIEEHAFCDFELHSKNDHCLIHHPVTGKQVTFGTFYCSLDEIEIISYGSGMCSMDLTIQWDDQAIERAVDEFGYRFRIDNWQYEVPLLGRPNAVSATGAIALAQWMGVSKSKIAEALQHLCPMPMRMEPVVFAGPTHSRDSVILINDAYNANPSSMRAAIEELRPARTTWGERRIVAILGDMLELGRREVELHRNIADDPCANAVNVWITIGSLARHIADAVSEKWRLDHEANSHRGMEAPQVHSFDSWSDDLPQTVTAMLQPGDAVLLKASRGMRLERLVPAIEQRFDQRQPAHAGR